MKRKLILTGIVIGSLLAIILNGLFAVIWITNSRLQTRLAALKADGYPLSIKDLAPKPLPPEKNAAVMLENIRPGAMALERKLQAVREHKRVKNTDDYYPLYEASDWAAVENAFAAHPQVLPALKEAAACDQYASLLNYDSTPENLGNAVNERVTPYRMHFQILGAHARLLAWQGRRDDSVRSCITALRLVRHVENEPLIVGNVISFACQSIAAKDIEDVIRSGPLSDAARKELDAELSARDLLGPYRRALKSELAYMMELLPLHLSGPLVSPFRNDALCEIIDAFREQIELADRPLADAGTAERDRTARYNTFRHSIARALASPVFHQRKAMEHVRARIRCLRVLIALQAWLERNPGTGPKMEHLGLTSEVTTDPYTDKPLQFRKTADGWLIYSLGMNLADDRGDFAKSKDVGIGPVKWEKK